MNKEIAKKWVAALKGGDYKQGSKRLRLGDEFCCLGVLCDLYKKETGKGEWVEVTSLGEPQKRIMEFRSGRPELAQRAYLTPEVSEWAGMKNKEGGAIIGDREGFNLIHLNDGLSKSFGYIAEQISIHVEHL